MLVHPWDLLELTRIPVRAAGHHLSYCEQQLVEDCETTAACGIGCPDCLVPAHAGRYGSHRGFALWYLAGSWRGEFGALDQYCQSGVRERAPTE